MQGIWRPLVVVTLALAVPIVPFLALGESLDARIESWLDPPPPASAVALATVGVLAADIVLPVPSSLVSTFAGAQLGIVPGTVVSWLGMTAGAVVAFGLARAYGRPLVARLSSPSDVEQIDRLARRGGRALLVLTRPLPILAEATVLLLGATDLSWRKFLPAVMLSNLGIAAAYAVLGRLAHGYEALPIALGASVAVPLAATTAARWLHARRSSATDPSIEQPT